ncbi:MAG: replication initiation protein [Chitinophagaceae bacterium]|jgi:hypothetical protein|nr:replication initiation protein [Chitinophagaceae bacterium]
MEKKTIEKRTKKIKDIILLPGTQTKIYAPNKFTNGRYNGFTLMQGKIFVTILKELLPAVKNSMSNAVAQLSLFETTELGDYKIPITLSELATSNNFPEVINAIKDFMKVSVEIKNSDKNWKSWAVLIPRVDEPVIVNNKSVVYVHVMKDVAEEIVNVKKNVKGNPIEFTQFIYEVVMNAKSQYTPIIYPFISSWKNRGGVRIDLQEFRKMIGLSEDKLINYSDLKRFVLQPVQKDLEKKADCWFNCSAKNFEERKGRKVVFLNFKIIVPELEEDLQNQYKNFKDMMVRHYFFSKAELEKLNPLFDAHIPYSELVLKTYEVGEKIRNPDKPTQINNVPAYITTSLLNEFL